MTAPFSHPVQVRYLEVDQQGVVFNAWYLAYLDEAMGEYLEFRGLPYVDMRADGYDVQLVHTELDWSTALRFGSPAVVSVDTAAVGTTSFTLSFAVSQDGQTTCTARTVYVCVALDGSGKTALPPALREALAGGEPSLSESQSSP